MSWRGVLLISMIIWTVGLGYLLRPQSMFQYKYAPFSSSGDGLTEEGEKAYKRFGLLLVVVGFGVAFWGLTL